MKHTDKDRQDNDSTHSDSDKNKSQAPPTSSHLLQEIFSLVCVTPHPHSVHRHDLAQQQEVQMFYGTGDDSLLGVVLLLDWVMIKCCLSKDRLEDSQIKHLMNEFVRP